MGRLVMEWCALNTRQSRRTAEYSAVCMGTGLFWLLGAHLGDDHALLPPVICSNCGAGSMVASRIGATGESHRGCVAQNCITSLAGCCCWIYGVVGGDVYQHLS